MSFNDTILIVLLIERGQKQMEENHQQVEELKQEADKNGRREGHAK